MEVLVAAPWQDRLRPCAVDPAVFVCKDGPLQESKTLIVVVKWKGKIFAVSESFVYRIATNQTLSKSASGVDFR
jgi:hypothetical protein